MQATKIAADQPFVLIVDDYEDTLFLYSDYLAFAGFRTSTAVSGAEAIVKARACLEDHKSSFPKSR